MIKLKWPSVVLSTGNNSPQRPGCRYALGLVTEHWTRRAPSCAAGVEVLAIIMKFGAVLVDVLPPMAKFQVPNFTTSTSNSPTPALRSQQALIMNLLIGYIYMNISARFGYRALEANCFLMRWVFALNWPVDSRGMIPPHPPLAFWRMLIYRAGLTLQSTSYSESFRHRAQSTT